MKFKPVNKSNLWIIFIVYSMLAACNSSSLKQGNVDSGSPKGESGTLAMVDSVIVKQTNNQNYAVINGFYPDACTNVSSVEQSVVGNTISITLFTDRPDDLICAAMLTPFTIEVLLTTGGLMPQEYSVIINEGPSTTFTLEY
jgi:hypothetical protein